MTTKTTTPPTAKTSEPNKASRAHTLKERTTARRALIKKAHEEGRLLTAAELKKAQLADLQELIDLYR
ncbi:hypothetical protein GCM10027275_50190 [Rhabdobacter roseus]|uniref:Uncharacterized protein n=1 Tax=Rhabdobacter roseus TaxID=1655419 RepID=A0A840TT14_9BACT|nr:hypothetical protein [Rhabdobacter roseus]MBB5287091.1 hypothetical protein [Rhabdobacter roseus]